jgi:hypothetical protein
MKRRFNIFGRKVALSTILTVALVAVMVTGVGAWAVLNAVGQVGVTTADQEVNWVPSGNWVCVPEGGKSNEGMSISKCAETASGGPDVEITGLETNNFGVEVTRTFVPQEQGLCLGIISTGTVPAELTIAIDGAVEMPRDLGDPSPITLKVRGTSELGPGENVEIPEITIGSVSCP